MEDKRVAERRNKIRKQLSHLPLSDTVGFRIMGFFVLILVLGTIVFEIFYIQSLYRFFYDNVSSTLYSQARYNAELFLSYVSDEDLNKVVLENKNQFYRSSNVQVQLLNNKGLVLFDSSGSGLPGQELKTDDILAAQENQIYPYVGYSSDSKEKSMSLSYPLRSQTKQVGMIRLSCSLEEVDNVINKRIILSILFGLLVILLGSGLSFVVSRSIINAIRNLTKTAHKYSDGQYEIRADESSIGEIGELARTMNKMSDNILEKEKIKNDFISSVSHELRTPLTSIKGWAITLQSSAIKPEIVSEGLDIIEKEADRLANMVEELLDFSRYSSGRIKLNFSTVNLVEISHNIVMQMQPRIEERKINLIYNYDRPSILIMADVDRIKQVILNILDNALKFTDEEGTVFLEISTSSDRAKLTVIDNGIGIAEDEINLVTEKFWKGSSSGSHSGLGLSISEEIVKAHGGSLTIKSKLDIGTEVEISLPLKEAKDEK